MQINKILQELNQICSTLNNYNYLCSKYFFINLITFIPISLLIIRVIIESSQFFWTLVAVNGLISSWLFIFFVSFSAASVTKEIHKSQKYLSKLQWNVIDSQPKIKVRF